MCGHWHCQVRPTAQLAWGESLVGLRGGTHRPISAPHGSFAWWPTWWTHLVSQCAQRKETSPSRHLNHPRDFLGPRATNSPSPNVQPCNPLHLSTEPWILMRRDVLLFSSFQQLSRVEKMRETERRESPWEILYKPPTQSSVGCPWASSGLKEGGRGGTTRNPSLASPEFLTVSLLLPRVTGGDFNLLIEVQTSFTCSHFCSVGLALANRNLDDHSARNRSPTLFAVAGLRRRRQARWGGETTLNRSS
jgi:hypothetical protein